MKRFVLPILICLLVACQHKKQAKPTSLEVEGSFFEVFMKDTRVDLYKASLIVPKGWRFANDDTVAKVADMTYRRRMHNSNGKLIYIEHGFQVTRDPSEPDVVPARFRAGYIKNNNDTTGVLFSDDPRIPEYRKSQGYRYFFETIAGHKAKLFEPSKTDVVLTGVYIDRVGTRKRYCGICIVC